MKTQLPSIVEQEPGIEPVRCTSIQERYLDLQSHSPGSSLANVAMRWLMKGAVRDQTIQKALDFLAGRHEALRTRFERSADGYSQIVVEASPRLSLIDLSQLSSDRYQAEAERLASLEARAAFDPVVAPPWRTTVLRRSPNEAILLLTFHHAIADGWSVGLIAREFAAAVEALERGQRPDLRELDLQYVDYAQWQSALLASDGLTEERQYWRGKLSGLCPLDIKPTRQRVLDAGRDGEIRSRVLPRPLTDALQALARREGFTMYGLACAALTRALGRKLETDEIIIGTQVANRDDPLLFDLVGPVVNTVVLRLGIEAGSDPLTHARRIRDEVSQALANKALPFAEIVAGIELSDRKDLPLGYAINFAAQAANVETSQVGVIRRGALELVSLPSVTTGCLYEFSFFLVERQEGWRISCEYNTDHHVAAAADTLLKAWSEEMEAQADLVESDREGWAPASKGDQPSGDIATPVALSLERRLPSRRPTRPYFQPCVLQSEGKLPPIFALSNRSLYYPLVQRVAAGRPFIDLQWADAAELPPLDQDSIRRIAADAVRQIRAHDPIGPYYLISLCLMGNVALEVAQQLKSLDGEVSVIFLLDTVAPGYVESMSRFDRFLRRIQLTDRIIPDLIARVRKVRSGDMSMAAAMSQYSIVRNNPLARLIGRGGDAPRPRATNEDFLNHGLMDYLLDARALYPWQPYDGEVVLFRSSKSRVGRLFERGLGWDKVVNGQLRIFDVPGVHDDMTREPAVATIAEYMSWMIDRREGRWSAERSAG
ncbi:condensation protein [Rhodopseudomonas palustris]|uniref:condensation domain-containing protein n=1 Tax=Rhodopseudomonas palustris TaxID=1076 RepID=UPI00115D006F|nr:condensation domain-containing protein [Rhodopseudomonas palustris]QDL98006.1 condensation protein [Rhodopseudomonas palustris]